MTKHHFPDVVQLGDITKLDGVRLWPVDIICAGSPCQDLSVAGKQEGLKGERSGLFRDAIRLVRDMRRASGGQAPRFFVWENVPGAFSSNKGLDFRAVLEEITETEIPMPENNKWADAGLVEWDGGSLAWRVLDAQYWGVPQRRRRIFLVADFGGHSAGEILFESKGLPRDIAESGEARERFAPRIESSTGGASVVRMRAGCAGGGKGALVSRERSLTLAANTNDQVLFTGNCLTPWDCQAKRIYKNDGVFPALQSMEINGEKPGSVYVPDKARSLTVKASGSFCADGRGPDVVATGYDAYQHHNWRKSDTVGPLTADGSHVRGDTPLVAAGFKVGNSGAAHSIGYAVETSPTLSAMDSGNKPAVAVYDMTHADEVMRKVPDGRAPTLNARMGTGGNQVPVVSYCVGNGQLHQGISDKDGALNCMHDQQAVMFTAGSFAGYQATEQSGSLKASGGDIGGGSESIVCQKFVRRLTPLEAERLQGLPDFYTLIDDKTCSDTARYKALGNGMAQPCADYVIKRIVEVVGV